MAATTAERRKRSAPTRTAIRLAVERRIIVAQALYAIGETLCAINTYMSTAVIILVQVNFALPQDSRWLYQV